MKKFLLSLILVAGGLLTINAQVDTLVTFEGAADTTGWLVFANGAAPGIDDVVVVENPDSSEANPTDSVLMFIVNDDADPWAGMVLHNVFTGDSAITITEEQHTLSMQVYRPSLGRVGLKLEREVTDNSVAEVLVATTLVDMWEVVTFDFSDFIGNTYQSLVLFPDFPDVAERTQGEVVYLDNIIFGEEATTSAPLVEQSQLKVYPNPAQDRLYVQHPGMTGYAISNSLGQEIERSVFGATPRKTIEISRLRTGIHFLTIQSKDGIRTTRFIKK